MRKCLCSNVSRGFLQGFDLKSMLFNMFVREEMRKEKKISEITYE